eukprot:473613_1
MFQYWKKENNNKKELKPDQTDKLETKENSVQNFEIRETAPDPIKDAYKLKSQIDAITKGQQSFKTSETIQIQTKLLAKAWKWINKYGIGSLNQYTKMKKTIQNYDIFTHQMANMHETMISNFNIFNETNKQQIQQWNVVQTALSDIQLQMNEERKNDDGNIYEKLDELQKTLQTLTVNNNNEVLVNNEKQRFEFWIKNELKLPQYYSTFMGNGIENLNVFQMLTVNELNEMNITKIGHKMQILHAVAELKTKSNKVDGQEGQNLVDTNQ